MTVVTPSESGSDDLCLLVPAAVAGDRDAWKRLVRRYTSMVRNVASRYHLNDGDVEDVTQTVWLRCFQDLAQLREVRALPGWLKTTAHHEALRLRSSHARSVSMDPIDLERKLGQTNVAADGSLDLLRAEANRIVREALDELPCSHRKLITMLHDDAQPSYSDISRVLGIPTGSIGPTRARCLALLRRTSALRSYLDATDGMRESA